jgi:protein-S-isoprenylcysteine O-methyltransferase Ste14
MFEGQIRHLVWLALLTLGAALAFRARGVPGGEYRGFSPEFWFWVAIATPVVHQIFVWFCWRVELCYRGVSRLLGPAGFRLYAVGFALLFVGRFVTLAALAAADRHSLVVDPMLLRITAVLISIPSIYLFYSVARYFRFARAVGADHFDASYRDRPLVTQGIFRFTSNGMYVYGLLALWLPGLLASSRAALIAAAFNHAYIWVHYYCTEKPDMRRIYGRI